MKRSGTFAVAGNSSSVMSVICTENPDGGSAAYEISLMHANQSVTIVGYHSTPEAARAATQALDALIVGAGGPAPWINHGFILKAVAPGSYAASKVIGDIEFLVSDDRESLDLPSGGPLTVGAYTLDGEDLGFFLSDQTLGGILARMPTWASELQQEHALDACTQSAPGSP